MLDEVLEWLRVKPDGTYVDATLGAGGHSAAIAQKLISGTTPEGPSGRLISLDRDAQALELARERLKIFGEKVTLVQAPFSRIAEVVHELGIPGVDGVLADLGVSSMQLDQAARGFSFREAGPVDMRVDAEDDLTADEIVNRWSEKEVADLLYQGAEEHDSRRIARAIVRARPIRDTAHLATVVAGAPKEWGGERLDPATLNPGGRLVVLSYHSGEDRMVKHAFQEGERHGTLRVLTRHVIQPNEREISANPRSRSAKLRCA